jgi:hypothetical protein
MWAMMPQPPWHPGPADQPLVRIFRTDFPLIMLFDNEVDL